LNLTLSIFYQSIGLSIAKFQILSYNVHSLICILFYSFCLAVLNAKPAVACGIKPETVYSTKRIVGGEETVAGEWPWMTALFHSQGNANQPPYFKCGATLLSDKWIATAAHCTLALPQIFSVSYAELYILTNFTKTFTQITLYVGRCSVLKIFPLISNRTRCPQELPASLGAQRWPGILSTSALRAGLSSVVYLM
jgi:hypothetical protein